MADRPAGAWVATKNGKTIAVALTAAGVLDRLRRIGRRADGAVAVWRPLRRRHAEMQQEAA